MILRRSNVKYNTRVRLGRVRGVGWGLPQQQRECRKAPQLAPAPGQPDAARAPCRVRSLFAHLGYKKAILAVPHRLRRVVYTVRSDSQPYHAPGGNYQRVFADRRVPRWFRDLKRSVRLPQD